MGSGLSGGLVVWWSERWPGCVVVEGSATLISLNSKGSVFVGSAVVEGSVTLISLNSKGSVFFRAGGRALGCLAGSF